MKAAFHPAASEELIETASYYEDQIPGLGEYFIIEVERIAEVLIDQPEIGQKVSDIFRRILFCTVPLFVNLQH